MAAWTLEDIDDLSGKVAVVTGGNSGLGFESVKALAAAGATVVMACRNADKAAAATAEIVGEQPDAEIVNRSIDLASQESVHAFAADFLETFDRLDILMNNAGVMAIPRKETKEGFEMQFGANHLGHFALTGLLIKTLLQTADSRVVTLTSLAAAAGKINFKDLNASARYSRWGAYGQSKLSNMLFGRELQRRLDEAGSNTLSMLAHPGFSATNLQRGPMEGGGIIGAIAGRAMPLMCQPQAAGALPQLRAATDPRARGGEYFGPSGAGQIKGAAVQVKYPPSGRNMTNARRLWELSSEMTDVHYLPYSD